jgi:tetratricopeptide (TPR) repeat protein
MGLNISFLGMTKIALGAFTWALVSCASTNVQDTTRALMDGNSAALRGDYSAAATSYESALKVSPKNSAAKRNLGIVFVKTGDFKKARQLLSEVQDEYKEDHEVFYFLGEASRGLSDYKAALGFYQKAAKINSNDLRVQKAMAWSYYRLGVVEKAFYEAQKLHRANSDDLQVKLILASILNKKRKYEEVQALLANVEKSKFNVKSRDKVSADTERTLLMNALAESYVGSDSCSKAAPLYQEILKSRPFLSSALIGTAKCDLRANQRSRAISRLERATKSDPEAEEAYFMLGQLYESSNRTKATYYYKRFLLLAKDNPFFVSESRITRSNLANLQRAKPKR